MAVTTLDERMQQAIEFFAGASAREHDPHRRAFYDRMRDVAEGVQENHRTLEFLKAQLFRVQQQMGLH